jgi:hypothetical protein
VHAIVPGFDKSLSLVCDFPWSCRGCKFRERVLGVDVLGAILATAERGLQIAAVDEKRLKRVERSWRGTIGDLGANQDATVCVVLAVGRFGWSTHSTRDKTETMAAKRIASRATRGRPKKGAQQELERARRTRGWRRRGFRASRRGRGCRARFSRVVVGWGWLGFWLVVGAAEHCTLDVCCRAKYGKRSKPTATPTIYQGWFGLVWCARVGTDAGRTEAANDLFVPYRIVHTRPHSMMNTRNAMSCNSVLDKRCDRWVGRFGRRSRDVSKRLLR